MAWTYTNSLWKTKLVSSYRAIRFQKSAYISIWNLSQTAVLFILPKHTFDQSVTPATISDSHSVQHKGWSLRSVMKTTRRKEVGAAPPKPRSAAVLQLTQYGHRALLMVSSHWHKTLLCRDRLSFSLTWNDYRREAGSRNDILHKPQIGN